MGKNNKSKQQHQKKKHDNGGKQKKQKNGPTSPSPSKSGGGMWSQSNQSRSVGSTAAAATAMSPSTGTKAKGLSALQAKFAKKLEGAKFRMINEMLYTSKGAHALEEFQKDPQLFDIYHEGFREQASHWPDNPLTLIIQWLQRKHPRAIVADLGAGDAELARTLSNQVHSFDLVSKNNLVIAADMAKLPLLNESIDVAVYCLSLMGTNIHDFLRECYRILKPRGIVKIAEVRSRFEGQEDGMKTFLHVLKMSGFDVTEKPSSNRMFFIMECVKSDRKPEKINEYSAKACVYKKR